MLTAPQIVITFTTAVKYDIKNWNKKVADKFDVIKKGDTHMHVTQIKLAEELGIPVSTLNNIMVNKTTVYSKVEAANHTEPKFF